MKNSRTLLSLEYLIKKGVKDRLELGVLWRPSLKIIQAVVMAGFFFPRIIRSIAEDTILFHKRTQRGQVGSEQDAPFMETRFHSVGKSYTSCWVGKSLIVLSTCEPHELQH